MIRSALWSLALGVGLAGCATDSPDAGKNSNAAPESDSGAAVSLAARSITLAADRSAFWVDCAGERERRAIANAGGLETLFKIFVADSETANRWKTMRVFEPGHVTALSGDYLFGAQGSGLSETMAGIFQPQFPLESGMNYIAEFQEFADSPRVVELFELPAEPRISSATVEAVYPSGDALPENLLKFYLHFSEPMRRGGVYEFISLVDGKGRKVDIPFLEVAEELWDPEGRRLTVFIDPGRVKREVKPLEDVGPAMVEGGRYELVISKAWPDETGAPMKSEFRKSFRVGPPDRKQPNVKDWKLKVPARGSREPLVVTLDDALDHALLHRLIWVVGADGKEVAGDVRVSENETRWEFVPISPWKAGDGQLVADEWLEDRAGNRIGRPFEVDIFDKVTERIEVKTVAVPFVIR